MGLGTIFVVMGLDERVNGVGVKGLEGKVLDKGLGVIVDAKGLAVIVGPKGLELIGVKGTGAKEGDIDL